MVKNLKDLFWKYIQRNLNFKLNISKPYSSFLNLNITIKESTFIYKLFNNRDSLPFSIVKMLTIENSIFQLYFTLLLKEKF